jgi:hypothetical protein
MNQPPVQGIGPDRLEKAMNGKLKLRFSASEIFLAVALLGAGALAFLVLMRV